MASDMRALEDRLQRAAHIADELAMKNQLLRDQVNSLKSLLSNTTVLYVEEENVSSAREKQLRAVMQVVNLGGGFDLSEEEET